MYVPDPVYCKNPAKSVVAIDEDVFQCMLMLNKFNLHMMYV